MENKDVEEMKDDDGPLKGKVLVPKIGKDEEFIKKFQEIQKIAHGPLGWDGHARLLIQLDAIEELKGMTFEQVKDFLQQSALSGLYEVGEWIPAEQAEQRKKSTEVLFGETPKVQSDR